MQSIGEQISALAFGQRVRSVLIGHAKEVHNPTETMTLESRRWISHSLLVLNHVALPFLAVSTLEILQAFDPCVSRVHVWGE